MYRTQSTEPFVLNILQEDNPIETLIDALEHPYYGTEVLLELRNIGDRRAIEPLLELAKKYGENKNSLYLYALTAFNCEEYVNEIVEIGVVSGVDARIHVYNILLDIETISYEAKIQVFATLEAKRDEIIKNNIHDEETVSYIENCVEFINEINLDSYAPKAKVLQLRASNTQ